MLTEPRVMFFTPSRAVLSAILADEYLTAEVKTKEGRQQSAAGAWASPIKAGTDAKLFNFLPQKYRLPIH